MPSPLVVDGLGYVAIDHLPITSELQADLLSWLRWWEENVDDYSKPQPSESQLRAWDARRESIRERLRSELPKDRYVVM